MLFIWWYILPLIDCLIFLNDSGINGKFMYFAYGSNMLEKRIHIHNPSAVRAGIGKLKDYILYFNSYSKNWKGASATIVEKKGAHVWGALWILDNEHKKTLDMQEGVAQNLYISQTIEVDCPDGEKKTCRVYKQTGIPKVLDEIEKLPNERKPSYVYLKTIIEGAKESGLPDEYIHFLQKIPHNGYKDEVDVHNFMIMFRRLNSYNIVIPIFLIIYSYKFSLTYNV